MDNSDKDYSEEEFYDNDQIDDKHEEKNSNYNDHEREEKSEPVKPKFRIRQRDIQIPEDATPESMIEINDKLTHELEELVVAVENQIDKVKKEKEEELMKKRMRQEPDPEMKRKDLKNNKKVLSLKKSINQMKKQIDNAYDVENTLVLENELKFLEKKHAKLMHSKKSRKKSKNALSLLKEDEDVDKRLDSMKTEVSKTKHEVREKKEELRTMEEQLKVQHAQTIELEQR